MLSLRKCIDSFVNRLALRPPKYDIHIGIIGVCSFYDFNAARIKIRSSYSFF